MATLVRPCARGGDLWGEFWWVGREYKWVFFDDDESSETHTEQVTHCPGCGRPLDRKTLKAVSTFSRASDSRGRPPWGSERRRIHGGRSRPKNSQHSPATNSSTCLRADDRERVCRIS